MIALDTNVVLRLFADDDAGQRRRALALIENADPASVFISTTVIVELLWALRRTYRQAKDRCVSALSALLDDERFVIDSRDLIEAAFAEWGDGRADFADYLIAYMARAAGASTTYTFDNDAAKSPAFTLLVGN